MAANDEAASNRRRRRNDQRNLSSDSDDELSEEAGMASTDDEQELEDAHKRQANVRREEPPPPTIIPMRRDGGPMLGSFSNPTEALPRPAAFSGTPDLKGAVSRVQQSLSQSQTPLPPGGLAQQPTPARSAPNGNNPPPLQGVPHQQSAQVNPGAPPMQPQQPSHSPIAGQPPLGSGSAAHSSPQPWQPTPSTGAQNPGQSALQPNQALQQGQQPHQFTPGMAAQVNQQLPPQQNQPLPGQANQPATQGQRPPVQPSADGPLQQSGQSQPPALLQQPRPKLPASSPTGEAGVAPSNNQPSPQPLTVSAPTPPSQGLTPQGSHTTGDPHGAHRLPDAPTTSPRTAGAPNSQQQQQSGGFPAQPNLQQQQQSGGFPAQPNLQQQQQSGGFPAQPNLQQQQQSGGFPAQPNLQQQQQSGGFPAQPNLQQQQQSGGFPARPNLQQQPNLQRQPNQSGLSQPESSTINGAVPSRPPGAKALELPAFSKVDGWEEPLHQELVEPTASQTKMPIEKRFDGDPPSWDEPGRHRKVIDALGTGSTIPPVPPVRPGQFRSSHDEEPTLRLEQQPIKERLSEWIYGDSSPETADNVQPSSRDNALNNLEQKTEQRGETLPKAEILNRNSGVSRQISGVGNDDSNTFAPDFNPDLTPKMPLRAIPPSEKLITETGPRPRIGPGPSPQWGVPASDQETHIKMPTESVGFSEKLTRLEEDVKSGIQFNETTKSGAPSLRSLMPSSNSTAPSTQSQALEPDAMSRKIEEVTGGDNQTPPPAGESKFPAPIRQPAPELGRGMEETGMFGITGDSWSTSPRDTGNRLNAAQFKPPQFPLPPPQPQLPQPPTRSQHQLQPPQFQPPQFQPTQSPANQAPAGLSAPTNPPQYKPPQLPQGFGAPAAPGGINPVGSFGMKPPEPHPSNPVDSEQRMPGLPAGIPRAPGDKISGFGAKQWASPSSNAQPEHAPAPTAIGQSLNQTSNAPNAAAPGVAPTSTPFPYPPGQTANPPASTTPAPSPAPALAPTSSFTPALTPPPTVADETSSGLQRGTQHATTSSGSAALPSKKELRNLVGDESRPAPNSNIASKYPHLVDGSAANLPRQNKITRAGSRLPVKLIAGALAFLAVSIGAGALVLNMSKNKPGSVNVAKLINSNSGDAIEDAKSAMAAGRWSEAMEHYDEAIAADSTNADLYHNHGLCAYALQQYRQALDDYNSALKYDEDGDSILLDHAAASFMLKDYSKAVTDYDKIIHNEGNNKRAFFGRALAYSHLHQYAKALPDLKKATALDPNYADAYRELTAIYHELGDYTLSLRAADQSLRLQPNSARSYFNKATALRKLGRKQDAEKAYSACLKLMPGHPECLNDRGFTASELGNKTQAIRDFMAALESDPQMPLASANLKAVASATLNKLSKSSDAHDLANAALAALALEQTARAGSLAAEAVKLKPQDSYALQIQGESQLADHHFAEAARSEAAALSANANNLDAYFFRARANLHERNFKSASADYTSYIDQGDKSSEPEVADHIASAHLERAVALAAQGQGLAAANDALKYVALSGWKNQKSGTAALIAWTGYGLDSHRADAAKLLDQTAAALPPDVWPSQVVSFLRRNCSESDVLSAAASNDIYMTDAHTWLGFYAQLEGQPAQAADHFAWVKERGAADSLTYLLSSSKFTK